MTVKEEVHRLVDELPESDLLTVRRVLHGLRLPVEPTQTPPHETPEQRRARVYALAGSAADLPGSVDEFMARKHEDTEREEERFRQRHGGAA